jgi:hypothetical protein
MRKWLGESARFFNLNAEVEPGLARGCLSRSSFDGLVVLRRCIATRLKGEAPLGESTRIGPFPDPFRTVLEVPDRRMAPLGPFWRELAPVSARAPVTPLTREPIPSSSRRTLRYTTVHRGTPKLRFHRTVSDVTHLLHHPGGTSSTSPALLKESAETSLRVVNP